MFTKNNETYTLCDAPWEAEALSLFPEQWLENQGRDIRISYELKERLKDHPPTHLEIGSHRARFLKGIALAHPEERVLGLEIRPKYSQLGREYIEQKRIPNVIEERVDAKLATIIAVPLESLDAVYVNFPDPWWKNRQSHRRLLDVPFLRVLGRRLKPRGKLYVKSDVFEYLYTVRRFAEESEMFRPLPLERWPDETKWTLSSREAKCMRSAIPFARGYYERRREVVVSRPTEPEVFEDLAWDEMLIGVEDIKGPPPIDRQMQRSVSDAGDAARASKASTERASVQTTEPYEP